ncbi:hypothetical protein [Maribellus sediminis]|uniref:hypothetical protein n=1 Tax=Maribellus sediminis TaxID=2696285 RepID=UPI0014307022|nr:hypothetical protein [Maribellus sediminis]
MKLVREGFIRIEKNDSTKIRIFWEVKLDALVFLSISIGLVIGFIAGFVSSMLLIPLIIGLLFSAITYFIGCSIVKSKIDKIVATAV